MDAREFIIYELLYSQYKYYISLIENCPSIYRKAGGEAFVFLSSGFDKGVYWSLIRNDIINGFKETIIPISNKRLILLIKLGLVKL